MAINKKLIHFKKKEDFEKEVAKENILDTSIVFIKDSKEIHTHEETYKTVTWKNIGKDPFNGYDYVDMGEVGIWATCNIGASKPEEYGLYFTWGETTGYANASDKPGGFTYETTSYCVSGKYNSSTKWSKYTSTDEYSSDGKADNKLVLEPEDDAAHINMGGDWRMPTKEEFQALYDACNTTWTTQNGVDGLLFTLKTDSSKQLFFPAAGWAGDQSMSGVGTYGMYLSSSLNTLNSYNTHNLYFSNSNVYYHTSGYRYYGRSVRGFIPKQS